MSIAAICDILCWDGVGRLEGRDVFEWGPFIGNNGWEAAVYGGNGGLGEYNGCTGGWEVDATGMAAVGCLFWIGNSGCDGSWGGLWSNGVWKDGATELDDAGCKFWTGNKVCGGWGSWGFLIGINEV